MKSNNRIIMNRVGTWPSLGARSRPSSYFVYILVSICHMFLQHLSIKLHLKLCLVIKRQSTTVRQWQNVYVCAKHLSIWLRTESDTDNYYWLGRDRKSLICTRQFQRSMWKFGGNWVSDWFCVMRRYRWVCFVCSGNLTFLWWSWATSLSFCRMNQCHPA